MALSLTFSMIHLTPMIPDEILIIMPISNQCFIYLFNDTLTPMIKNVPLL